MKINSNTKDMIRIIAKALGELNNGAVFVGGAILPYYIPEIFEPRPTEDIDVVMEIVGYKNRILNEEKLREKGFRDDTSEGAPQCRWIYKDFKIDILSTDSSALGFTNKWYKEGVEKAIAIETSPVPIKILTLPYFIATKLEAFKSRGNSDYMASHDMEDIISVLEVASEDDVEQKLLNCSNELKNYLRKEFKELLKKEEFLDMLPGSMFNSIYADDSAKELLKRIEGIVLKLH